MLHSYAFKNFLSFKERTEVSFALTKKASSQGWDVPSPAGQRLATAVAVIGANGAGKTSLLKPVAFLSWFVQNSFLQNSPNGLIPIKPHFSTPHDPIEFEIVADDLDGTLWRYELTATRERVLSESVHRRQKRKERNTPMYLSVIGTTSRNNTSLNKKASDLILLRQRWCARMPP